MSHDTECPYCGAGVDICHDDGYGYEESRPHNQDCPKCGKTFVFRTTISYHYETDEAPCLNGGDHSWRRQILYGHDGAKERGICDSCETEPADIDLWDEDDEPEHVCACNVFHDDLEHAENLCSACGLMLYDPWAPTQVVTGEKDST